MQLLQRGNRNRSTEPTAANKVSSRSHAVMQIVVEARDRLANLSHSVRTGKLSLIDLAGSERASATQNSGLRMIEGANINRSLLALANCINALGEAQKSGVKAFVPYRDSKLTRLLKDSLGGNARTVMIANISPAANVFEETHNTLKYANRAKNIKTKITRNVHAVESHIANYQSIINELRAEVQQLRQQLQVSNSLALGPSNQTVVSFSSTSPKNGNQRSVGPASPSHQRRGSAGAIPPSEQRELEAFRAQLQENFKNRLQIKRNLLDLEEMSLQQTIELNRRQVDIDIFEQLSKVDAGAVGEVSVPKRIRLLRMEASSIKDTLAKTAETKDAIVKQYAEWEAAAMELHQSMQSRITSSLARSALEMEISAQALQLENIEAEEGVLLQQLIIKQRDLSLKKMEIQLQLRDELIAEQKHLLRQLQPSLVHNSNPEDLENGTPRDDEKEFVDARNLKELHEREMKISASLPMLVRPRGNATHANASIAVSLPAISITPSARHPRAPSGKSVSSSVSLPQLNGQSKLRAPVQPRRAEFESDAVSSTPSGASSLIASHPYRPMVSQIAQRSASRVSSQSVEKPAPAISAFGFRHPVQSNAISVNATAVPTRSKIVAPKRK
jgi:kinesin family protein 18/19